MADISLAGFDEMSVLVLFLAGIYLLIWIVALFDCLTRKHLKSKFLWFMIIFVGGIIGVLLYYAIGKHQKEEEVPEVKK